MYLCVLEIERGGQGEMKGENRKDITHTCTCMCYMYMYTMQCMQIDEEIKREREKRGEEL